MWADAGRVSIGWFHGTRLSTEAETTGGTRTPLTIRKLQWSRLSTEAETRLSSKQATARARWASMEPPLDGGGDLADDTRMRWEIWLLQWSRLSTEAEPPGGGAPHLRGGVASMEPPLAAGDDRLQR